MLRKLIKIFIFSLVIFSFNVISAEAAISCRVAATCNSSEVDCLELSDTANAHAAKPGSGYPFAVCCSGPSGLSTSCSQNKVIAKLSGAENAHVRLNTESDYPGSNNACLSVSGGTLTLGNQEDNCDGFDTTIVSLAKVPTNSHVGEGSVYPNKICAKYKAPSSSGGGGWLPDWLRGGGGSQNNIDSGLEIEENPLALITPAPVYLPNQSSGYNISAVETGPESSDLLVATDQNYELAQTVSYNKEKNNIPLMAAVGESRSSLLTLINSTWFKRTSFLVILAMVIFARKYIKKRK